MNGTREAKCKDCQNRTPERFCKWLQAFLQPGIDDDPNCEGYACPKSPQKEMTHTLVPSTQDSKDTPIACPKAQQPDIELVQTALAIKRLKGSVVREKVCCGKPGCHCHTGALHPANYLHYYSNEPGKKGGKTKIKRLYLSKAMTMLLSHSTEELEGMLRETEAALGQEPSGRAA